VLTSESSETVPLSFRDNLSGTTVSITLPSGRSALLLVGGDGKVKAEYRPE
jgi:hypothetical protein